jgi:hypothetical protein
LRAGWRARVAGYTWHLHSLALWEDIKQERAYTSKLSKLTE